MTGGWGGSARPAPIGRVDGYPIGVSYVDEVVPELSPAWLSAVAVLHGQPPLPTDRPLRWLDLGMGRGVAACAAGAADPTLEIWGYDANPAHIERARDLAARAGLANCRFAEASFEQLAAEPEIGPADVDVVVLNGVYSWVSPANQGHIRRIIHQRLRPGGLVYVMYESPTGWSALEPWIEVLQLHVAADDRPDEVAFADAAAAVRSLLDHESTSALPRREAKLAAGWATASGAYAAHEYLGEHFQPVMLSQVAGPMAEASCAFLGGTDIVDHLSVYWAPPEIVELVTDTSDPVIREEIRDLITQRALRRDLFRRGLAAPLAAAREAWVRELRFVGPGGPYEDRTVDVPAGQIRLDRGFHQPITEALASADDGIDVGRVEELHPEWGWGDASSALALQVAAGFAVPTRAPAPPDDAVAACRRLNELLVEENLLGADHDYLASPVTGSVVRCDPIEVNTIGALWRGHARDVGALADHSLALLARDGKLVREAGVLIADAAAARTIVERRVAVALDKVDGAFRRLGIS